jgi:very-short-patch-repair endonuclease
VIEKNNQSHPTISDRTQSNISDKRKYRPSSSSYPYKKPEATIYEDMLASALDKLTFKAINYVRNPEIWISACIWYTPDFIIGKRLIIEVDGGIHEFEYRQTPDRIRQRALENMGYSVYRVKNEQIEISAENVAEQILDLYYKISEVVTIEEEEHAKKSKIQKITKPNYEGLPEDLENSIGTHAIAFNLQLNGRDWTSDFFKETLPKYDQRLITNQCAIERFILQLIGLNLRKGQDNIIDFEHSSKLFRTAIKILSEIFGSNIFGRYLQNSFNITATNFLKNLVFQGGPKINPGIVSIDNTSTLELSIEKFNQSFSKLGITVEKADVKIECMKELKRRAKKKKDIQATNNKEDLGWLVKWCES